MEYIGRTSKTYKGGLNQKKLLPKNLRVYAMPELGDRDFLNCLKYYISLIPSTGPFYWRPTS